MLKHCVFLNFKPEINPEVHKAVFETLADLQNEISGMLSFNYGPNHDFEQKSESYSHGFIATFADRQAHLAYESHPAHVKAGAKLVEMCVGGFDGILVFDLEVS